MPRPPVKKVEKWDGDTWQGYTHVRGARYHRERVADGEAAFRSVERPRYLYKHTGRAIAPLICDGSILLRPLSAYKAYEAKDPTIGDRHEGQRTAVSYLPDEVLDKMDPRLREYGVKIGHAVSSDVAANTMVWCLSTSDEVGIARLFKTDAVVEVPNEKWVWLAIASAVSRAVGMLPEWTAAAPVQCVGHRHVLGEEGSEVEDFLLKRPHYACQREFRLGMLFLRAPRCDRNDDIGPCMIVKVPALAGRLTWRVIDEQQQQG